MKSGICLIVLGLLFCLSLSAQTPPKFTRVSIGESGCTAYFPAPAIVDPPDTLDENTISYYVSASFEKHSYGLRMIRILNPLPETVALDENPESENSESSENEFHSQDSLKNLALYWISEWQQLTMTHSSGAEQQNQHPRYPDITGWQDVWVSEDEKVYKSVQIWLHPTCIVQLEISGRTEFEDEIVKGIFFRGVHFPEKQE